MMALYRLMPLLSLAGVAACASSPSPATPAPRRAEFIEAEYQPYLKPGNGVVAGQVLLHTLAGEVRYGAGREVYLNPVTTYSSEWWNESVVGGRELADGDARARQYERLEIADRQGRFTFSGLPAGEYYLLSLVPGDVAVGNPAGSETHGDRVGRRVRVSSGSKVEVALDELERDSTGVADTTTEIAIADQSPDSTQPVLASTHTESDGSAIAPLHPAGVEAAGDTAPGPAKTAVRPYSAPPPVSSDEPMAERRGLTRFVPTRRALSDVIRLKIVSEYEEARPGLLVLALGEGYSTGTSVEYNLKRLFAAYEAFLQYEERAVLELWLNGQKIGEYTRDGLLVGPEYTAPR